ILLEQTTKEYNQLYIHLLERNYKLITKTHGYTSCLFLLESHEGDLNLYDILLLIKDDNLTKENYINLFGKTCIEQEIIDSSSIISSSDNILIELVAELYQRTKQSSTLSYEALLLLRPLPLFASTQQLYLQILAYTIFAFFFVF
ncbi:unnamed protein product, partial [Rotaria sp. Silwood2]